MWLSRFGGFEMGEHPLLNAGDLVLVNGDGSLIDRGITLAESREALGDPAYDHCFIVKDSDGTIIDTLARVRIGNINTDYAGRELLIGRYRAMNPIRCKGAIAWIEAEVGEIYPFWRIALILFGLGRWVKSHHDVCSERLAEFAHDATGLPQFAKKEGWTPSDWADVIKEWTLFKVVYEGTW